MIKCNNCENMIEECEPEYCCDGYMCGCMGKPINFPDFLCDECLTKMGYVRDGKINESELW
jgi:hypothetical protein